MEINGLVTSATRDKNRSQIVFDFHGNKSTFATMTLYTISTRAPSIKAQTENFEEAAV
jgi:hypothetical protein